LELISVCYSGSTNPCGSSLIFNDCNFAHVDVVDDYQGDTFCGIPVSKVSTCASKCYSEIQCYAHNSSKPFCDSDGTCKTACNSDYQCHTLNAKQPFCDSDGTCVALCDSDKQCYGIDPTKPYCLANGTCSACNNDDECYHGTTGSCGGDCHWSLNEDNGVLTIYGRGGISSTSSLESIESPVVSVIINPGITSIGKYAFAGFDELSSVVISNTVSSIRENAFLDCVSLASIIIPDSVTFIGDETFENCKGLTNVCYSGSSNPGSEYVFYYCDVDHVDVVKDYQGETFCGKPTLTVDSCTFKCDSDYQCYAHDSSRPFCDSNSTCVGCDSSCRTCSGINADNCTSCFSGHYLKDGSCKECDINCKDDKCEDGKGCTECQHAFYLQDGVCVMSSSSSSELDVPSSSLPVATSSFSSEPQSSSHPATPSTSSQLQKSSSDENGGSNGGMIAGIVIGAVAVIALIAVAIYCAVTSSSKHGKMDPIIFEDDPDSVSMSVL